MLAKLAFLNEVFVLKKIGTKNIKNKQNKKNEGTSLYQNL